MYSELLGYVKVSRRLDLVYGGGSIGLMGLVSQAVHRGGGNVLGYNQPSFTFSWVLSHVYSSWFLLSCTLDQFFLFLLCIWFTLDRIIPRTLMCKEVHNLSIFQMGFLLPFLFVEICFLFCSTGSKLSPFCLQVCMVPLKTYACVVLSLTDNRWNSWRGKASSRHAPKEGRNGPPFWLFHSPTRSPLSLPIKL